MLLQPQHTPGPYAYDTNRNTIVSLTRFEPWSDPEEPYPVSVICTMSAMGGENTNHDLALLVASAEMFELLAEATGALRDTPFYDLADDIDELLERVANPSKMTRI